MRFRCASFCALFAISCLAQTSSTSPAPALKIFHDASHDLTLGYPGEFTPVEQAASKNEAGQQCVRSILTAGSETKLGSSAFVVSVIDATCPGVLKQAEQPSAFTREQILRQLKGYGLATLTQDDSAGGSQKKTTYAAKACVVSDVSSKKGDKQSSSSSTSDGEVICFDYTTQNRELLTRILSFTVRFADGETRPVVPGSALR